ncbi:MAG: hypothetical protein QXE96_06745 [Candidatus Caldarchaeum sp.]
MAIDAVYWSKFIIGLGYGVLAAWLAESNPTPAVTYLLIFGAALLYIFVSEVFWRLFDNKVSRRRSYLNGVGGYAGMFLLVWILMYNLFVGT